MPNSQSIPKATLPTIEGSVPNLNNMPEGCRFASRCPYQQEQCLQQDPELEMKNSEHQISCHFWSDLRIKDNRQEPVV